jgi:hypothetical protein
MAVSSILSALAGMAGTLGGITTGTSRSSTSLLSPIQQIQNVSMMSAMSPYLKGHYSKLADLGASSPNAYNSLGSFSGDYNNMVRTPALYHRQREMMQGMGDPAHRRSSDITRQNFTNVNRLGANSLKQSLMLKDMGMQTEGLEGAANRRLMSYGASSEGWMQPMGRVRENYYSPGPDYSSMISGGLTGWQSLKKTFGNIVSAAVNSGAASAGSGR